MNKFHSQIFLARFDDESFSYNGLNRHAGEEVGVWYSTLAKEKVTALVKL